MIALIGGKNTPSNILKKKAKIHQSPRRTYHTDWFISFVKFLATKS